MRPEFDTADQKLLDSRLLAWSRVDGPRVGDYVRMLDGTLRRFTHDWGDSIQTTHPKFSGDASFYFAGDYMSFSGSLDSAIPKMKLIATTESKPGYAWFFHHNESRAHNGVSFQVPCRVFEQSA